MKELSRSLGINRQLMPVTMQYRSYLGNFKDILFTNDVQVGQGFAGCMKNLTVTQGGVTTLYSLGNPADFQDEESFKVNIC